MLTGRTLQASKDHRGVLSIILDRPALRNALNQQLLLELDSIFQNEVLEPDVRVVILRGNGPVFCAGADLYEMQASIHASVEENAQSSERLFQLFLRMNACPKPLIGIVHGAVMGGGIGLVSVCDSVISTKKTTFCLSELRLGLVPACISPFLIAKIGISHTRRLSLSAQSWDPLEALSMGLIHEIVQEDDLLDTTLERHILGFLSCAPGAIAVTKKMILDFTWPSPHLSTSATSATSTISGDFQSVSEVLAHVRVGDEAQEGMRAFFEKRQPHWLVV